MKYFDGKNIALGGEIDDDNFDKFFDEFIALAEKYGFIVGGGFREVDENGDLLVSNAPLPFGEWEEVEDDEWAWDWDWELISLVDEQEGDDEPPD